MEGKIWIETKTEYLVRKFADKYIGKLMNMKKRIWEILAVGAGEDKISSSFDRLMIMPIIELSSEELQTLTII